MKMSMRTKIAREMFRKFVSDAPSVWLTLSEPTRNHWLAFADSALIALREPTPEMIEAARAAWLESASDYTLLAESLAAAFTAAIDAEAMNLCDERATFETGETQWMTWGN